jgi:DNA-binding winged helix-turn-helix (wHTH) protein
MTHDQPGQAHEWFCALLDTVSDVYFRYTLVPNRRLVYLSKAAETLTGFTREACYADSDRCLSVIAREDRHVLRRALRARRGAVWTIRVARDGTLLPVEIRTVPIIHHHRLVALEGVARLKVPLVEQGAGVSPDGGPFAGVRLRAEPVQQRLAALMYEVHDLLHRVLPAPRSSSSQPTAFLRVGNLSFDPDRLTVTDEGQPVALTGRELLVLRYFLQRPGRVLSRRQLLTDVWGYSYTGDDRTVDVHISRLRRKLPSLRERLVAIKNLGYRLDEDTDARIANF